MKKNGFTLIELLAVIVILAIIAIIAVPIILNVIEESQIGAFKDSVHGVIKAAEFYYAENEMKDNPTYKDTFEFPTDNLILNYKGKQMQSGKLIITDSQVIIENLTDGVYVANGNSNEFTVTKLNESLPPEEMPKLEISDKNDLVGILYSTWFNPVINDYGQNQYNITEILAGAASWGPENAFHYWAKPALGYYRSDDKNVIRTHMTQLAEAGVDFIIVDNTNTGLSWWGTSYWDQMVGESMTALLDTIVEMREEGLKTPYVVTWNNTNGDTAGEWMVTKIIYNLYIDNPKYENVWVYWDNKPFVLTTEDMSSLPISPSTIELTWRKMWGLQPSLATYEWSYLQTDNIKGGKRPDGTYEQMSVSVAMQQAYMSNTNTIYPNAIGRNYGITWYNQWAKAFTNRPKVVTVTWWNEWIAQRIYANSRYNFTDNYNAAYSRDIEPMTGGHGDQYYRWLTEYIRAYKAHETVPRLVEEGH